MDVVGEEGGAAVGGQQADVEDGVAEAEGVLLEGDLIVEAQLAGRVGVQGNAAGHGRRARAEDTGDEEVVEDVQEDVQQLVAVRGDEGEHQLAVEVGGQRGEGEGGRRSLLLLFGFYFSSDLLFS